MHLSVIQNKIYKLRGKQVMIDFDLAQLYEVETRALKQAVKRNLNRFPIDFMFILTEKEVDTLVSQFVIPSKSKFGGSMPMVFTEQGVAMLSSILRSDKAIEVNIAVMRTFVMLREFALNYEVLQVKIKKLEKKYNKNFSDVFKAMEYLLGQKKNEEEFKNRRRIGFKPD